MVATALGTNDQVHVAEPAQVLSLRDNPPPGVFEAKAIAVSTFSTP